MTPGIATNTVKMRAVDERGAAKLIATNNAEPNSATANVPRRVSPCGIVRAPAARQLTRPIQTPMSTEPAPDTAACDALVEQVNDHPGCSKSGG